LAIAQVLQELEDGHQGQPPGRQTGLPSTGVERGEVLIAVQRGALVAQARDRRAAWKRRSGHTFGLCGDGFYRIASICKACANTSIFAIL
jgi:hypothetical protein